MATGGDAFSRRATGLRLRPAERALSGKRDERLLSPAGCPGAADAELTTFSNLVADAVRDVDPDTIVFYEPFATNFNAGFPTHHGDVDAGNVGFSFHLYACLPPPATCPRLRPREQKSSPTPKPGRAFGHVPLLTEFGATDDLHCSIGCTVLADAFRVGWQYWAWWNRDPCCDRPDEGIIDDPANPPTPAHLKRRSSTCSHGRIRAPSPGSRTRWTWDRGTRRFTLSYATTPVDARSRPAPSPKCGSRSASSRRL